MSPPNESAGIVHSSSATRSPDRRMRSPSGRACNDTRNAVVSHRQGKLGHGTKTVRMNRVWYGRVECTFRPLPAIPGRVYQTASTDTVDERADGCRVDSRTEYDGYRIVARKDGAIVRLWSRNGINWASQFPMIVDAILRLPVDRIVLEGEAVCLRPDGHPVPCAPFPSGLPRRPPDGLRPSGPGWSVSDAVAAPRAP